MWCRSFKPGSVETPVRRATVFHHGEAASGLESTVDAKAAEQKIVDGLWSRDILQGLLSEKKISIELKCYAMHCTLMSAKMKSPYTFPVVISQLYALQCQGAVDPEALVQILADLAETGFITAVQRDAAMRLRSDRKAYLAMHGAPSMASSASISP